MGKKGFIMLHRSIQQHWLYDEKRKFSKYEAWLDMLMMANHSENKFVLGNELIELEAGQFVTSIRKLGERWDWSNTKVTQFLELLNKDEMLSFKKDTKKTLVTIVKYGFYQGKETEEKTQNEHKKDTNRTQKHTNNNVNNDNNEKNDNKLIPYVEIVDYLNLKAGTKYKHSSKKTKDLITARWNEKFVLTDFQTVIDKKTAEWLNDPGMNKYLRPETLFGSKFESYLNQIGGKTSERNTGSFSQTPRTSGRQYNIELPTFDYKQR